MFLSSERSDRILKLEVGFQKFRAAVNSDIMDALTAYKTSNDRAPLNAVNKKITQSEWNPRLVLAALGKELAYINSMGGIYRNMRRRGVTFPNIYTTSLSRHFEFQASDKKLQFALYFRLDDSTSRGANPALGQFYGKSKAIATDKTGFYCVYTPTLRDSTQVLKEFGREAVFPMARTQVELGESVYQHPDTTGPILGNLLMRFPN